MATVSQSIKRKLSLRQLAGEGGGTFAPPLGSDRYSDDEPIPRQSYSLKSLPVGA